MSTPVRNTDGSSTVKTPARRPFASLTSRLVATVVLLLAVLALSIAVLTGAGMRSYLTAELDQRIVRVADGLLAPRGPGGPPGNDVGNQAPGTLVAGDLNGLVTGGGFADDTELTTAQREAVLDAATTNGTTAHLEGLGSYRLRLEERRGVSLVVGLPTDEVDAAVTRLWVWEGVLSALGLALAAGLGWWLVRRQLAPLREVAATAHRVVDLPLSQGATPLTERVPDALADGTGEVGQVGAALNQMLDHVDAALASRHRSEQQVRQFVADASHELRTPLATVRGYAELARRRPDDVAVARTALDKVEHEAERMGELVEDLLLLARLDQGRPLLAEPVDLAQLAAELVNDARVLAPGHHWRMTLEPAEVVGDAGRLSQVVSNLVTNAWRHTPDGTTVEVAVTHRPSDGAVVLSVADDGPGIGEDLRGRVFERFARGDTARQRAGQGTGLGLSLVEAIIGAHGGTVELQPRPGGGTVAVVVLADAESRPAG